MSSPLPPAQNPLYSAKNLTSTHPPQGSPNRFKRGIKWAAMGAGLAFALGTFMGIVAAKSQAAQNTKQAKLPLSATSKITATKTSVSKTPPAAKNPAEKLVWEAWYTVSSAESAAVQYYLDRVTLAGDKLHFTNQVWKREEGFINEEQLGAFSASTADLTPLFFNFRRTYRSSEMLIDGTVQPDHTIVVKVEGSEKMKNPVRRNLPPHTIFSSFFPVWVREKQKVLKIGERASFYAFQEDDVDNEFSINTGSIRREPEDEYAKKTKTNRLAVEYRGISSTWWVDQQGIAEKILMPQQKIVVERKSQSEAKQAFERANQS